MKLYIHFYTRNNVASVQKCGWTTWVVGAAKEGVAGRGEEEAPGERGDGGRGGADAETNYTQGKQQTTLQNLPQT